MPAGEDARSGRQTAPRMGSADGRGARGSDEDAWRNTGYAGPGQSAYRGRGFEAGAQQPKSVDDGEGTASDSEAGNNEGSAQRETRGEDDGDGAGRARRRCALFNACTARTTPGH